MYSIVFVLCFITDRVDHTVHLFTGLLKIHVLLFQNIKMSAKNECELKAGHPPAGEFQMFLFMMPIL